MPVVEVKQLSYHYADGLEALKNITFCLEKGESVGLIGANGAGKSSLLLALSGLLEPSQGSVHIDGLLVCKKNLVTIRNKLGLLFLNPDDQLFTPRVFDDVAFGPCNQGHAAEEVLKLSYQALEDCGAIHLAQRAPFRLSSGEKRMAALAAVLAMQTEILLMDEPSVSLDAQGRRSLITILNKLNLTKIIVSHDLEMCRETCQRLVVLDHGSIVADETTQVLLKDRALLMRYGLIA